MADQEQKQQKSELRRQTENFATKQATRGAYSAATWLSTSLSSGIGAAAAFVGGAFTLVPVAIVGITALIGSTLAAIGAAVAIAVGVIFLSVIFIFTIINTGALVVPPSEPFSQYTPARAGASGIEFDNSQYIDVTKEACPILNSVKSCGVTNVENLDLPLEVEYDFSITATGEALTNISLAEECTASIEGGPTACPNFGAQFPSTIPNLADGETYEFSAVVTFSNSYQDSIVVNTITVTADALSSSDEVSVARDTLIIGEPPTSCFDFQGNWSEADRALEQQAIAVLMQAPKYMAELCADGEISLKYVGVPRKPGWGGYSSGRLIEIYPRGLGGIANTLYTLAHETGHVYDRLVGVHKTYQSSGLPGSEDFCHLRRIYPNPPDFEQFAEMIAMFFAASSQTPTRGDMSCMGDASQVMQKALSDFPNHIEYAKGLTGIDLDWP